VGEIFQENLVRGRGLYCRSIMKAQLASPAFTPIYAALTAVINTKLPENGETLLKRVIMQFRRSYKRNDKPVCTAMVKFIAHLINQQVCHEILGLQLLTVLLEKPTDDSVELAVSFVKEAGNALQQLSPQGLHAIFERFRGVLHEGSIEKRVQYMIEGLFAVRKSNFADFPALEDDLDLVDADDQITHELSLDDQLEPEAGLDIFHVDPQFGEHEEQWASLKRELLGEEEGDDEEDGDDEEEDEDEEETEEKQIEQQEIQDQTETDLVNLRRTIYLTIQSSMQSDEAAHKLLKLQTKPGQEKEMLRMIIECGMQEKSYMKYYGVLAERFCKLKKEWEEGYNDLFAQYYATVHRLETNKLRNVAKMFGHLMHTEAMAWTCLEYIQVLCGSVNVPRYFLGLWVLCWALLTGGKVAILKFSSACRWAHGGGVGVTTPCANRVNFKARRRRRPLSFPLRNCVQCRFSFPTFRKRERTNVPKPLPRITLLLGQSFPAVECYRRVCVSRVVCAKGC